MKKTVALILCILFCGLQTAYAGFDQDQKQKQGQVGINKQGQAQGQVGINKAVGAGNETSTNVESHDNTDVEVLSPTWAPTPSTQGKEETKVYSLWGGLDANEIARDVRVDHQIKTLKLLNDEGIIDDEIYSLRLNDIYYQLAKENKTAKVLGIIPVGCKNPILKLLVCF